uniref:Uncharacterized protein n=1 Tax=Alexandrium monilatum TaxID=311494 RepID=A0A7S4Q641_9DINO
MGQAFEDLGAGGSVQVCPARPGVWSPPPHMMQDPTWPGSAILHSSLPMTSEEPLQVELAAVTATFRLAKLSKRQSGGVLIELEFPFRAGGSISVVAILPPHYPARMPLVTPVDRQGMFSNAEFAALHRCMGMSAKRAAPHMPVLAALQSAAMWLGKFASTGVAVSACGEARGQVTGGLGRGRSPPAQKSEDAKAPVSVGHGPGSRFAAQKAAQDIRGLVAHGCGPGRQFPPPEFFEDMPLPTSANIVDPAEIGPTPGKPFFPQEKGFCAQGPAFTPASAYESTNVSVISDAISTISEFSSRGAPPEVGKALSLGAREHSHGLFAGGVGGLIAFPRAWSGDWSEDSSGDSSSSTDSSSDSDTEDTFEGIVQELAANISGKLIHHRVK